jgi:hypothetical protein
MRLSFRTLRVGGAFFLGLGIRHSAFGIRDKAFGMGRWDHPWLWCLEPNAECPMPNA